VSSNGVSERETLAFLLRNLRDENGDSWPSGYDFEDAGRILAAGFRLAPRGVVPDRSIFAQIVHSRRFQTLDSNDPPGPLDYDIADAILVALAAALPSPPVVPDTVRVLIEQVRLRQEHPAILCDKLVRALKDVYELDAAGPVEDAPSENAILADAAQVYVDAINAFIGSPAAEQLTPEQGIALMERREDVCEHIASLRVPVSREAESEVSNGK